MGAVPTGPRCLALVAVWLCALLVLPETAHSHKVTQRLVAGWKSTPLVMEMSEILADFDSFWPFVDELVARPQLGPTDKDRFNALQDVADKLVPAEVADLAKLSLTARAASPAVEMFFQVAQDHFSQLPERPTCTIFVIVGGQFTCDVTSLDRLIESAQFDRSAPVLSVDHVYGVEHSQHNSSVVSKPIFLYANVASPSFKTWHKALVRLFSGDNTLSYVLRHYLPEDIPRGDLALSGYGVELAIKKTEYRAVDDSKVDDDDDEPLKMRGDEEEDDEEDEIAGINFSTLRKRYPDSKDNLDTLRDKLLANSANIKALKAWEIQELAMLAAQHIASSPKPLEALMHTSQNLPTMAQTLVTTKLNETFQKAVAANQMTLQRLGLSPGDELLLLNNMVLQSSALDVFSLLNVLSKEARTMANLKSIGIPDDTVQSLLPYSGAANSGTKPAVDLKSSSIVYVNDLETDQKYSGWSKSLYDLLQPIQRGSLYKVARNIFTIVLVLDPAKASSRPLFKALYNLVVKESYPIRLGVLFTTPAGQKALRSAPVEFTSSSKTKTEASNDDQLNNDVSVLITRAFAAVKTDSTRPKAFEWLDAFFSKADKALGQDTDISMDFLRQELADMYEQDAEGDLKENSSLDTIRSRADAVVFRRGISLDEARQPRAFLNGAELSIDPASVADAVYQAAMTKLPTLQRQIYYGQVPNHVNIAEHVNQGGQSRISARTSARDGRTLPESSLYKVQTGQGDISTSAKAVDTLLSTLPCTAKKGSQFKIKPVTTWVIADFSTQDARRLAFEALKRQLSGSNGRVGLLDNGDASKPSQTWKVATAIAMALPVDETLDIMGRFFACLVNGAGKQDENDDDAVETCLRAETTQAQGKSVEKWLASAADTFSKLVSATSAVVHDTLQLRRRESAVMVNFRLVGPLQPGEVLLADDFKALESLELKSGRAQDLVKLVKHMMLPNTPEDSSDYRSGMVAKLSMLLAPPTAGGSTENPFEQTPTRVSPERLKGLSTDVAGLDVASSRQSSALEHQVLVILDPASESAQKVAPILLMLSQHLQCRVQIIFNPQNKVSELPVKRYYRMSLPKLVFDAAGTLQDGPQVVFRNLPLSPLLTLGLDTPTSWLTRAIYSQHDLDNIHLETARKGVRATFRLDALTIEGSCYEVGTLQPAAGVQLRLASAAQGFVTDTIVMANLGYFQLKAAPGAWQLRLHEGRSSQIFAVDTARPSEQTSGNESDTSVTMLLRGFGGVHASVGLRRRQGMEAERVLDVAQETMAAEKDQGSGLWNSLRSFVSGGDGQMKQVDDASGLETINVFSIASGHLYERFLKIMMLSVLKNTKNPVKFWFLEDCMSPQMKAVLPHMASKYNFQYELVRYNWPAWLNKPKEKMRLIWAYKILFLDVLFPLDVKKIIFVDADQIVRTDLRELVELDLHGAPYGYTPFCDSREGMDGFRFWQGGYWKTHLAGKPYHISALYVVDLLRFRSMAAGDRLREQYQGLSQDPNSLSNLDQDLPNNMIHSVPIFSLPQEWLWCETWCDEPSKKKAKTIDLCNNPKTKEPKLDAAVRIVPEWVELDREQKAATAEALGASSSTSGSRAPSNPSVPSPAHQEL